MHLDLLGPETEGNGCDTVGKTDAAPAGQLSGHLLEVFYGNLFVVREIQKCYTDLVLDRREHDKLFHSSNRTFRITASITAR